MVELTPFCSKRGRKPTIIGKNGRRSGVEGSFPLSCKVGPEVFVTRSVAGAKWDQARVRTLKLSGVGG